MVSRIEIGYTSNYQRYSPAQFLVHGLIIAVFIIENLDVIAGPAGRFVRLVPEYLSLACLIVVVGYIARGTDVAVHSRHVIVFGLFGLHVVAGMLAYAMQPGAVIVGIRYYFKYVPFFVLPLVYRFSDYELLAQWKWILWIGLMQLPVVLVQRFVLYADLGTGDVITGTLNISSELSLFLVVLSGSCISFAFVNRWSAWKTVAVLVCLLAPTTLNETKGTLILAPIVMGAALWYLLQRSGDFRILIGGSAGLVIFATAFFSLYDVGKGQSGTADLVDLIVSGKLAASVYQKDTGEKIFDEAAATRRDIEVGRVDALLFPFHETEGDWLRRLMGFGAGNVSKPFHELLAGDYVGTFEHMAPEKSLGSILLWEVGLVGLFLFLLAVGVLFLDARNARSTKTLVGIFAIGWFGVPIVLVLMLPYKNVLNWNMVGYFVMLYSGVIVSHVVRCVKRST